MDEARLGANLARRNGDQGPQRRCDDEPATAEQHCSRKRHGDRRDQQRAPSPDRRNQHERGEERPEQAAHRRERVQPPGDGACVPDVLDAEPHRERRDHAEQDHRRGEEREHGEEGADRRSGGDLVEPLHRDVEERPCRKGNDRDQHSCGDHDAAEDARARVAVRHLSAQPVADGERGEDEADDVRPDDRRAPVVGREQPGGGDLGGERSGTGEEDEHVQRVREPPPLRRLRFPRLSTRTGHYVSADDDDGVVVPGLAGEPARVGDDVLRKLLGGELATRGESRVEPVDPVLDAVPTHLDQPVGVEAERSAGRQVRAVLLVVLVCLDAEREPARRQGRDRSVGGQDAHAADGPRWRRRRRPWPGRPSRRPSSRRLRRPALRSRLRSPA